MNNNGNNDILLRVMRGEEPKDYSLGGLSVLLKQLMSQKDEHFEELGDGQDDIIDSIDRLRRDLSVQALITSVASFSNWASKTQKDGPIEYAAKTIDKLKETKGRFRILEDEYKSKSFLRRALSEAPNPRIECCEALRMADNASRELRHYDRALPLCDDARGIYSKIGPALLMLAKYFAAEPNIEDKVKDRILGSISNTFSEVGLQDYALAATDSAFTKSAIRSTKESGVEQSETAIQLANEFDKFYSDNLGSWNRNIEEAERLYITLRQDRGWNRNRIARMPLLISSISTGFGLREFSHRKYEPAQE